MANIHTVKMQNGDVAKRTSLNRVYTHAVVVSRISGSWVNNEGGWKAEWKADGKPDVFYVASWHSREDLARKAALAHTGPSILTVNVFPCQVTTKESKPMNPAAKAKLDLSLKARNWGQSAASSIRNAIRWQQEDGRTDWADKAQAGAVESAIKAAHFGRQRLHLDDPSWQAPTPDPEAVALLDEYQQTLAQAANYGWTAATKIKDAITTWSARGVSISTDQAVNAALLALRMARKAQEARFEPARLPGKTVWAVSGLDEGKVIDVKAVSYGLRVTVSVFRDLADRSGSSRAYWEGSLDQFRQTWKVVG